MRTYTLLDTHTDKHIEFYCNSGEDLIGFEVWDGDVLITSFELDKEEAQRLYAKLEEWL